MKKTILIIGIIFLLGGVSVTSSINARIKDSPSNYNQIEIKEFTNNLKSKGKIAYAYCVYDPSGQLVEGTVYFNLDDPGNITLLASDLSPFCFSGGTWTNECRYLANDYGTGILMEADPCDGARWCIGGGGVSLIGLSYNPITEKLYGASPYALYDINIENGTQTFIGNFSSGPLYMICIAFDENGILYGWDIGTDTLWIIDTETAEISHVGPLGIDLNYAQDGAFDYETDILYLSAYSNAMDGQLYTCDKYTGQCTLVGDFQGGAELCALAIPFEQDIYPPETTIIFDPKNPDGDNGWYVSNVTATLRACDISRVNATYYRVNEGEWQQYESNFIISEEGDDVLIEYYSVDTLGIVEDVKSATIDIDKTSPEMIVNISKIKIEWQKWWVIVNVTFTDNLSGVVYDSMDRIEFYLNGVLQDTVTGSGPYYTWKFLYYGGLKITIGVGAHICDKAGNCDDVYNETKIYFSRNKNQLLNNQLFLRLIEHFPLLQRLLDTWRDVLV